MEPAGRDVFLDWLKPAPGLKWIDIGCGNGAFTEQIVDRCQPAEVLGVDPSEGQLAFARQRPAARLAKFQQGGAESLPVTNRNFDVATMALVTELTGAPHVRNVKTSLTLRNSKDAAMVPLEGEDK